MSGSGIPGKLASRADFGELSRAASLVALAVVACIPSQEVRAATYYVSGAGDDGNAGRSAGAAWRTLARAERSARSGDTVLLRRGDVFRETAQFGAGITMSGAGGPQDRPPPAISGSVKIVGWKVHKGRIHVARVGRKIEHLFVDGKLVTIARHPNEGWLRTEKGTKSGLIVDSALARHPRNAPRYWEGATVRWRKWSWWFETRPVASYDPAGRLSLGGKSHGEHAGIGSGYYLDSKLEELDAPGEWYFDPAGMKVYLYAPGGGDPNELLVEGSCLASGLSISGATVEHVSFRHQTDCGLSIAGKCLVRRCRFEHIRSCALRASWGAHGSRVAHSVFEDNLNVAIAWNQNPKQAGESVIEHNVLRRTGVVPGYGGSGPWHAAGIIISGGTNIRIRCNTIEDTGYAGIILGSDGNYVEYNTFRRAMSTLNDGAAIYTNCSRSNIRHNVILDTVGNLESSHPWANLGHGIWPEFLSDFRESVIEGNTVAGSGGFGLFLPNNFDCTVRSNVFYDNARAQMELSGMENNPRTGRTGKLPYGNTIEGNVFFSRERDQAALLFRPEFDYGSMKGNYFCNPYTAQVVSSWGRGSRRWSREPLTIAEWQKRFSWADSAPRTDAAKVRPSARNPIGTPRLVVNDSPEERELSLGSGVWRDLDGQGHKGSVTLGPYTSKVLVLAGGSAVRLPRYTMYSEIARRQTAAAKPKKKREPVRAVTRRVPKPGAIAENDTRLIVRLKGDLERGGSPKIRVTAFRLQLSVLSIDDRNTLHLKGKHTEMTMEWPRLALSDRRSLALDLLREGNADDHCLAAFYLMAEGDERGARDHLGRSGDRAAEVEAFFALSSEQPATEDTEATEGNAAALRRSQRRSASLLSETSVASGRPGARADAEIAKLYKKAEALFIEGDRQKAREMLEQVLAGDQGGEYGRKAKEFLELVK